MIRKPIEEEFAGDKATIEWLNAQKLSTQAAYRKGWRLFRAFTGLTGDQILADREGDTEAKWEKKTLEFKTWVLAQKTQTGETYSEGAAKTFSIAVRSFFGYHRKDLQFRTTEALKLKEARRKKEDYRYTRENLADMANLADLQGKYIVIVGKSFGMRVGDFLKLVRGALEPYLKLTPPISIGELPTEKEGVNACPFIDTDALPIIQAMIYEMDREGRTGPEEPMLTIGEVQVNKIMKRLTAQAGIKVGNKRVRFHCLRKFLSDRLSSHMAESKWKQVIGKKIDEKAYVSPDLLRDDYARAMADTCFTKAEMADVQIAARKEALRILAKNAGYSDAEISHIIRESKDVPEIEVLERLATNPKKLSGGGNFEAQAERVLAKIIMGALKKIESGEVTREK